MPWSARAARLAASSWIELMLVLAALGVISAIARPRLSAAAAPPAQPPDDVLAGRLKLLESAILDYAADHEGRFPWGDGRHVARQLLEYTDARGNLSPHWSRTTSLGPYLKELPPLPLNGSDGPCRIHVHRTLASLKDTAWVYNPRTGQISAFTGQRPDF